MSYLEYIVEETKLHLENTTCFFISIANSLTIGKYFLLSLFSMTNASALYILSASN